ncbi:MAG: response regulator [Lachnospiraceae bacterium]|nr:response regulator [Lachnospiraceae bacterium]
MVCTAIIIFSGVCYFEKLKDKLETNMLQHVMDMTLQQEQSFDDLISNDREQLRSYAVYFSQNPTAGPQDALDRLTMFQTVSAEYIVVCLEEGLSCSNTSSDIIQLDEESMEAYRSLNGSGVRDKFIGIFGSEPKFSYYETFTFADGHHGVILKRYDRNKVTEAFNLSFYGGQGYGYILNQEGDILLRSVPSTSDRSYNNVFDALADTHSSQEDIASLTAAIDARETGSFIFTGDNGSYVYTFTPLTSADGWYLLSIVPEDAVQNEADEILRDAQMTLGIVALMLIIGGVFILLFRHIDKDIKIKDKKIEYQARLFDTLTDYISRNTDDVYMLLNQENEEPEYISGNAERVLGVKPEDVISYLKAADQEADFDSAMKYDAMFKALVPGGESVSRTPERIDPRTGERRYFKENVDCVDIQGQRKRLVYISDRTMERKTQNSLTEALHMAKAANNAKTSFLSSISHDIRTPMNAIIGFLALMRDEVDNPDVVMNYNKRIDAASQHLLGLINDVLDMNKIESGSATLSISEMDLADVIDEINVIIRPQTKAKSQTFEIVVTHMAFEHLLGDKLRLNQILINLLSNAVKYTPENGTIELRVEELPQVVNNYSRVRFTVSDNGMGMSEAYQKVLFDPFTRDEDNAAVHEIQGTGLGMPITKNLVELMGGTIEVKSKQGEGSTFIVELEFCIQEREADQKFWADHQLAKMIVADDDEETCCSIVKTMSKVGVITDYATNGHTAVQMMREHRESGHPYDLILLDWKMPTLDGLETARLIRQNYPDKIPILLLTAYDWSDIEQEAMEIGVDHFMPKPFFLSNFKEAVKRIMGSQNKSELPQSDIVQGKHVLVVDDLKVNRFILVKLLGTLGAVCDTADNGQEAVEKFQASQPDEYDLILMDVQMPVMDGYTATRTIRSSSHPSARSVPIIAMTANAFVDDVREAIESGMDAHIAKPVQIDNLKTTIRQVLDSRAENANR